MRKLVIVMLAVGSLAGCGVESRQPPVSTAPTAAGGPPSKAPESPNALPPGSQVDAPFVEDTIGTTRVGPAGGPAPVSSARPPSAGLGSATQTGQPRRVNNGY